MGGPSGGQDGQPPRARSLREPEILKEKNLYNKIILLTMYNDVIAQKKHLKGPLTHPFNPITYNPKT